MLVKYVSQQTGKFYTSRPTGGIWWIRPILRSESSRASLAVSGLALHAEDQQCAREGRYDMTIWTGPETERKNTLERMRCCHYNHICTVIASEKCWQNPSILLDDQLFEWSPRSLENCKKTREDLDYTATQWILVYLSLEPSLQS